MVARRDKSRLYENGVWHQEGTTKIFATAVVFNALGWEHTWVVRANLPDCNCTLRVSEIASGAPVVSQCVPDSISGKFSAALYWPVDVPAIGTQTFSIEATKTSFAGSNGVCDDGMCAVVTPPRSAVDGLLDADGNDTVTLVGGALKVNVDQHTGLVTSVNDRNVKQEFVWDKGVGGAYLLIEPEHQSRHMYSPSSPVEVVHGPIVSEASVSMNGDGVKSTIRVYGGISGSPLEQVVETVFSVGPIGDDVETSIQWTSDVQTDQIYTDDMGIDIRERSVDRSSVAGSSEYALIASGFSRNDKTQMTLLSDHTVGFSSPANGTMSVRVHRRMLQDDHQGLGPEVLNDTLPVVDAKLWLHVGSPEESEALRPLLATRINQPMLVLESVGPMGFGHDIAPLTEPLPANLHLMSFKIVDKLGGVPMPMGAELSSSLDLLVRAVHLYQPHLAPKGMSAPAEFSPENLLRDWKPSGVDETALTGRGSPVWSSASQVSSMGNTTNATQAHSYPIVPLQIRTFRMPVQ